MRISKKVNDWGVRIVWSLMTLAMAVFIYLETRSANPGDYERVSVLLGMQPWGMVAIRFGISGLCLVGAIAALFPNTPKFGFFTGPMLLWFITGNPARRLEQHDFSGFWGLFSFICVLNVLLLVGEIMQAMRWPPGQWSPREEPDRSQE